MKNNVSKVLSAFRALVTMSDGLKTNDESGNMSVDTGEEKETESRKIQQLSRVAVPEEWWDDLGMEVGDEVLVRKEDEHIEIHSMEKIINEL